MALLKDNTELRYEMVSATNVSIQFGSVNSATMLEIFMLIETVQTCASGDIML